MTVDRPMIALTPLMDYGRDSLWMLPGYMEAIERAGGVPVMLPLSGDPVVIEQCARQFDGFLFTGGPDVGPWVKPGKTVRECPTGGAVATDIAMPAGNTILGGNAVIADQAISAIDVGGTGGANDTEDAEDAEDDATGRSEALSMERDRMETLLLHNVVQLDKPVFGICRGIQLINRWFGGTLWQDLPSEHPSAVEHHMNPPYDAFGHDVMLAPSTPLAELFAGEWTIAVNSYHHQAVREVAAGFEVMAEAPDGVVEAIRRPASRFLWAVQWHPEFLYKVDPRSQQLFDVFVAACHG
ncbi:gamma-glutamyl-gamma-aminobutyrate hydrolase family protein [Bifidobacterium oedipodis]|uniref:Amidotransferase n=1 Tax=Bifidobacterium oedipodis TaxID=2675322 RepID=A0A7Y0EM69_9BIFI|nr:gamma-glutamyl-gamma-aminobutyrate hydrolase family protein [Bifidobacterium sp. DSM 109957]NMM92829.1 amidotransferase [Bifidobacterium sp. DSM 109957]